jgi:hypothetical protein
MSLLGYPPLSFHFTPFYSISNICIPRENKAVLALTGKQ